MRTTLDLPDATFRRLKAEAALRGAKLKDVITQFIENGLAEHSIQLREHRSRSALPTLRPPTGVKHPAMSNTELEDLLTMEETYARK